MKALGHLLEQLLVVLAVPGLVEVELLVEGLLIDVGQDGHPPAQQRLALLVVMAGGGKDGRWPSGNCASPA